MRRAIYRIDVAAATRYDVRVERRVEVILAQDVTQKNPLIGLKIPVGGLKGKKIDIEKLS